MVLVLHGLEGSSRSHYVGGLLAGAHYGLAFLLLQRGDPDGAAQHLKTFLAHPPRGPDAQKWIEHATQALQDLRAGEAPARAAEERTGSP